MKNSLPKQYRQLNDFRVVAVWWLVAAVWCALLIPHQALAQGIETHFSGYVKSLNFFTRTSGFVPEMTRIPGARAEEGENLFTSLNRFRLQMSGTYPIDETRRIVTRIHYDQQAYFGSFVASGDFRIMRNHAEQRQFLDLSQTLVEDEDGFYEQRFYRISIAYETDLYDVEIGRQQIPWGVGHFFTPTDLFNPFVPTQIELDERDGVDAVNLVIKDFFGTRAQLVYTPRGRELHPQRYLARLTKDVEGYEVSVLGGRVGRDHAMGFDFSGNLQDFAVRGEFLYREAQLEKDFMKFTVNADYNFPHNIYGLLEYHFNGQGRRNPNDYQRDRLLDGDIQQLGKNFLAMSVGYDITPLLRIENRTIFNMDDQSFYERPELQYEARQNLLFTAASQLFLGANNDEYGNPKNLFLFEAKYSF